MAFEADLDRVRREIAATDPSTGDLEKRTRLAYRLFHRASMTGIDGDFAAVEDAVDRAITEFGPQEDLCLLRANLDFRFHRLDAVLRDLALAPLLARRVEGRALIADLDFQHGRYERARIEYERLVEENRTWDTLARLAYFNGIMGDVDAADRLYAEAEDEVTAKEMFSFAWLELQRGLLDLTHGRHAEAEAHYRRAGAAYPGHWQIDEHLAELLAARGLFAEAIELFERVAGRAPKPELFQALGELYVCAGRDEEAGLWFERALMGYLESCERGGVHYFHHLADFYCDVREDGAEAVKWASKDLELRDNFGTQSAMAWAFYRAGRLEEAAFFMRKALASSAQDAHLFSRAAAIFAAAGQEAESARYLRAAELTNPEYRTFHVHR